MNLNTIFDGFCSTLTDVRRTSHHFSTLQTDLERIKFTWPLFIDYYSTLKLDSLHKSAAVSIRLRQEGNEAYKRHKYKDALKLYNKCIAFATSTGEEIKAGIANRILVLIQLRAPHPAMLDVIYLCGLHVDPTLLEKLKRRLHVCADMLEAGHVNNSLFVLPSAPQITCELSTFFDSTSSIVSMNESECLGRYLTVNQDVPAGQILIVEQPFSSVLLPDQLYTHCSHCFKQAGNLRPCPNCATAMFCNSTCLGQASFSHKIECGVMAYLVPLNAQRMELLSTKTVIEASKQGMRLDELMTNIKSYSEAMPAYSSKDHKSLFYLVGNSAKRNVADLFHRTVTACLLTCILRENNFFDMMASHQFVFESRHHAEIFCGSLILRYLQSLPCNAHEISEYTHSGLVEIGAGAYPTLSLLNHACDPNVVRHSYGSTMVLRALRPIQQGEEIVDNYGYHYATQPKHVRQSALLKQYYFECNCKACCEDWPLYSQLPNKPLQLSDPSLLENFEKETITFEDCLQKLSMDINDDSTQKYFFKYKDDNRQEYFLRYLQLLHNTTTKPCKLFNQCEEAIKQCLNLRSNRSLPELRIDSNALISLVNAMANDNFNLM